MKPSVTGLHKSYTKMGETRLVAVTPPLPSEPQLESGLVELIRRAAWWLLAGSWWCHTAFIIRQL